jgi:hypothetical protein
MNRDLSFEEGDKSSFKQWYKGNMMSRICVFNKGNPIVKSVYFGFFPFHRVHHNHPSELEVQL